MTDIGLTSLRISVLEAATPGTFQETENFCESGHKASDGPKNACFWGQKLAPETKVVPTRGEQSRGGQLGMGLGSLLEGEHVWGGPPAGCWDFTLYRNSEAFWQGY